MGKQTTGCDYCSHYIFDEICQCYLCEVDLDEDEMVRFLSASFDNCPYFQLDDEYRIVRRQM